LFVPGGFGQVALMSDQVVLSFLRQQAKGAKYVTSVCTGALVLGAAGLLEGCELAGEQVAKAIQLGLEYDPAPPFASGHPDVADPALVEEIRSRLRARLDRDTLPR